VIALSTALLSQNAMLLRATAALATRAAALDPVPSKTLIG